MTQYLIAVQLPDMQAPGGPTEDPTGDFKYGGWLPPHASEEGRERVGELFNRSFDLLLGRRTYRCRIYRGKGTRGRDKRNHFDNDSQRHGNR